jgi:hypothetical protein
VGKHKGKDPVGLHAKLGGIKGRHPSHAFAAVHELAVWPGVAQEVGDLVGPLAQKALGIDREPTARTAIENVGVVQVTV